MTTSAESPPALPGLAAFAIPTDRIESRIYLLRGEKVLLDFDLAELYEVETKVLNQTVKRHADRFPSDFMFQLTEAEGAAIRSQIVTASRRNARFQPYAFTEHTAIPALRSRAAKAKPAKSKL